MINLDKYIEEGIQVKLRGKEVTILQLTAKLSREVGKLESNIDKGDGYDNRAQITLKILNNNKEGIKFTQEDVDAIPVKLQVAIGNEIAKFTYQLMNDPN